jgi:hypothetical protein
MVSEPTQSDNLQYDLERVKWAISSQVLRFKRILAGSLTMDAVQRLDVGRCSSKRVLKV